MRRAHVVEVQTLASSYLGVVHVHFEGKGFMPVRAELMSKDDAVPGYVAAFQKLVAPARPEARVYDFLSELRKRGEVTT